MVRHPSAHAMLPMCEAEEAAMQASLNAGIMLNQNYKGFLDLKKQFFKKKD